MATNNQARRQLPFWLQIILILLAGAALSVIVLLVMRGSKVKNPTQQTQAPTEASAVTNSDPLREYTVTFAYQDGTVIDTRKVKEGHGVFPPELETDHVFRGWTGAVNYVTRDTEVHPAVYAINSDENLFYFNSQYVKEGECFTIDLNLAGLVNISKATLEISYDPEVMELQEHTEAECCKVEETAPGLLILTLDSQSPLRQKTLLSSINFLALEKDVFSSKISLSCKDPKLLTTGGEVPVTGTTINNEIYYLQEVD